MPICFQRKRNYSQCINPYFNPFLFPNAFNTLRQKKFKLIDYIYKCKSYTDKICYKYRYMNKLFEKFWWVEINVDKYQGDNDKKYNKTD